VKQHECHEGKDTVFDSLVLDEDKLLDIMEPILAERGNIIDYHTCDFFPERWFDLILVLTTNTEILYDRLQARGYSANKVNENMECEIMQVVADSARESYAQEIVHILPSNTIEDMENNLERLSVYLENWKQTH
jgi:adenylate kinase